MLKRFDDWMTELGAEAPWYFWVYVAMAMASTLFGDPLDGYMVIAFTVAFVYLMKTYDFLRKKYVYIIVWPVLFTAEKLLTKNIGQYIYLYSDPTFRFTPYYYNYATIIISFFATILSTPVVIYIEKNIKRSLQILLCIFCISMACDVAIFLFVWMFWFVFLNWY